MEQKLNKKAPFMIKTKTMLLKSLLMKNKPNKTVTNTPLDNEQCDALFRSLYAHWITLVWVPSGNHHVRQNPSPLRSVT